MASIRLVALALPVATGLWLAACSSDPEGNGTPKPPNPDEEPQYGDGGDGTDGKPAAECTRGADCQSGVCKNDSCQAPTRTDGIRNGNESDTDCGRSGGGRDTGAPVCQDGKRCGDGGDCQSGVCTGNVCQAPTKSDGVKNGNETDVDCGSGPTDGGQVDTKAPGCADQLVCLAADDCQSNVCEGNVCQVPSSSDGVKNGNETDVDCGRTGNGRDTGAGLCADGLACTGLVDCQSGVCKDGACQVPSATDRVKNGNETDVDCGSGPTDQGQVDTQAPACRDRLRCLAEDDCQSRVCTAGLCQAPTCLDQVKNLNETDVDCGGANCGPCADTLACLLARDCQSGVCTGNACQAPTASDGVKNGNETDIDCGRGGVGAATNAPVCRNNLACVGDTDCFSGKCVAGSCRVPTANDGVKNGNETDIDCGSSTPIVNDPVYGATTNTQAAKCDAGRACVAAIDCLSQVCQGGVCQAPSFNDGVKNGNETDVDCGGPDANANQRCAAGKVCNRNRNDGHTDCLSNGCIAEGPNAGRCATAPSCTMNNGGFTCGAGDFDFNNLGAAGDAAAQPLATHENCCTSLPVPNFSDAAYPGKTVQLDKYEITAGRMREFLRRVTQQYGVPNVRQWLTDHRAANPGMRWNDSADAASNWTRWLPANTGGRANDANQANWNSNALALFRTRSYMNEDARGAEWGNVGTDFLFGVAGWYFYVHGHNCDTADGYPTYWYPDAFYGANGGPHDGPARRLSQQNLDRRALNCAPLAMLAAFCAWDGGQLATSAVLASVTNVAWANRNTSSTAAVGRLPARASSNWTSDAGNSPTQYNLPTIAGEAARIAPPGRMVNDKVQFVVNNVSYGPWMDLRGNLQEAAIRETVNPLTFSGVHYDGLGRDSARGAGTAPGDGGRDPQAFYAEFKAGTVGARCMRYVD